MDPVEQLAKFGVDPVRYFLLKEGSLLKDGSTCIASVLWSFILTMTLFRGKESMRLLSL